MSAAHTKAARRTEPANGGTGQIFGRQRQNPRQKGKETDKKAIFPKNLQFEKRKFCYTFYNVYSTGNPMACETQAGPGPERREGHAPGGKLRGARTAGFSAGKDLPIFKDALAFTHFLWRDFLGGAKKPVSKAFGRIARLCPEHTDKVALGAKGKNGGDFGVGILGETQHVLGRFHPL